MRKIFVLLAVVIALTGCRGASRSLRKGATEAVSYFATEQILKSTFDSKKEKEQSPPKEDLSNSNYLQSSVYSQSSTHLSKSTYLSYIANDINKDLPMMIDRETMLVTVTPLDDALVYNGVLVNISSQRIDSRQFLLSMKRILTNSVCSEPNMRAFVLNDGVSLHYSYSGNDHIHIGQVAVSPADCKTFNL